MFNQRKAFKNYHQHLKRFILLSCLIFIVAGSLNLFLIFSPARGELINMIPSLVHYLVVGITAMMLMMGIFYYRSIGKNK